MTISWLRNYKKLDENNLKLNVKNCTRYFEFLIYCMSNTGCFEYPVIHFHSKYSPDWCLPIWKLKIDKSKMKSFFGKVKPYFCPTLYISKTAQKISPRWMGEWKQHRKSKHIRGTWSKPTSIKKTLLLSLRKGILDNRWPVTNNVGHWKLHPTRYKCVPSGREARARQFSVQLRKRSGFCLQCMHEWRHFRLVSLVHDANASR